MGMGSMVGKEVDDDRIGSDLYPEYRCRESPEAYDEVNGEKGRELETSTGRLYLLILWRMKCVHCSVR